MHKNVTGIVLAAGLSTRMGALKQVLPIDGEPMVARVCRLLLDGGLDDIVVILGHEHQAVGRALRALPVRTLLNPAYRQGEMISSVRTGLRALSPETLAALIALGDQPFVSVQTIRRLLAAYAEESPLICQPSYRGRPGHPILLQRALWPNVLDATPETTLRDIIRRHNARRSFVAVDDPGILHDLDRPDDSIP
jgi:molybdenum cofactor cytidylyltransferase